MYCRDINVVTVPIQIMEGDGQYNEWYIISYYDYQYPRIIKKVLKRFANDPELSFDDIDRKILLKLMKRAHESLKMKLISELNSTLR